MPDPGPGSPALLELLEVMRRLRAECPWKAGQTHRSLVRYLVEELHETVDAIESGTPDDLREELGDLLLQVYFHAVIAEETGDFTLDDVAAGIVAKMRRRNPHVFAPDDVATPADAAAVNELWESVKAGEKRRDSVTDGLAPTLPALLYADKVVDRLGRAGAPTALPAPVLLLVPSPLLGPATWAPVAWWLRGAGHDVEVVDLGDTPRTPAAVVEAVVAAAAGRPVVLVPHSNAGLYAPHLATLLDVRATVHVDAALPTSAPTAALAPPDLLAMLAPLADDGLLPVWTQWWDDVDALFPDAASRAAVEAEQVRVPLSYLQEHVPVPAGWAEAPAAYLALGDTYAEERSRARASGWPVRTLDGTHLHALHDPAAVGAAVSGLLADLLGPRTGERLLDVVRAGHDAGVDPEQALRDAVRRLLRR
ncbi:MazG nucleotide pyrophosphohydrolase domain-containing protein [Nocardioides dongxiaopingii]|uniref:MazG nucleotide pyrophosphohydrolase domain-containing protein n=1 Tax=Nocardioides dongxiaopingii TaxID=2576036 RepID=UPI001FE8AE33|nr:MazG nucleotide pyrophosphohydrolase domain-containing protein [Nocardioides dongxiaopingii]